MATSSTEGVVPLFLIGEITAEVARRLSDRIMPGFPCLLVIDSGGGDVESAEILAALISDNGKVTAIVVNQANSMAIPLLQACRRRIALPNASFFFHTITSTRKIKAMDVWNAKKVEALVEALKLIQERYWERIHRRVRNLTTKPEKELTLELLRQWCDQEVRLSAEEAKAYGLVDEVLPLSSILNMKAMEF